MVMGATVGSGDAARPLGTCAGGGEAIVAEILQAVQERHTLPMVE